MGNEDPYEIHFKLVVVLTEKTYSTGNTAVTFLSYYRLPFRALDSGWALGMWGLVNVKYFKKPLNV